MIATTKEGYQNNITTYGRGGGYGIGSYGRGYMERHGIPLIHAIKIMVFHLI